MLLSRLAHISLAISLTLSAAAVHSQANYPNRPVTMITPGAPGAGFELLGRIYFQKLSENVGQSFVMDFKPGAGQTLGTALAAKAAPDGYTLLFTSATHTVGPILYKDLSYDPVKSFIPITQMTSQPIALLVTASVPAKNLQEYVAYVKSNRGKVNMAIGGNGSLSHFAGAWLNITTGMETEFIAYKAAGPVLLALVAGETHSGTATLSSAAPHIKAGKIRALGITSLKRSRFSPDMPTVAEQGVPGFDYDQWQGVLAPIGTPAAIISKLNAELVKVAKSPDVVERIANGGDQAVGSTQEEFRTLIVTEVARWRKVYEATNLKLE